MYPAYSISSELKSNYSIDLSISKAQARTILVIQNRKNTPLLKALSKAYVLEVKDTIEVGLEHALASIPQLIIFDLDQLHDMFFIRHLKNNLLTQHIPIIVVSSLLSKEIHIECLKEGVDAVYEYPADECILLAQVYALLKSRESLKNIFQYQDQLISKIEVEDADSMFVNRARQVVVDNLSNSAFNIVVFVSLMGVSRTQLYIKIKGITNLSTSEFVREIRLKEAAKLLKKGIYNVSEVAFKVGFNDPKYLSRKFKEMFQISPSAFQKGRVH